MTKDEFKQVLVNGKGNKKYLAGDILSKESVEMAFPSLPHIVVLTSIALGGEHAAFFTTNHMFGHGTLPDIFVPCSMSLPYEVKPRVGCEDGICNTLEKYMVVHKNYKYIWSIDELMDYLEKKELVYFDNTICDDPLNNNSLLNSNF